MKYLLSVFVFVVCRFDQAQSTCFFFFLNDPATTEIYPFPLHDALPICLVAGMQAAGSNRFTILMAGTAAVCSGAFSMSAGAYLSSKAEKEIFDHELEKEASFIEREPHEIGRAHV